VRHFVRTSALHLVLFSCTGTLLFRLLGALKGFREGMLFASYTDRLAVTERQKRIYLKWQFCNTKYCHFRSRFQDLGVQVSAIIAVFSTA
jgi:L-rhamnose isomerase